jgi:AI-2 transport protein TqsA
MIAGKVRQYLYVRTVLGAMSATIAGVWLLLLDVDLVLVWVLLTFLLNYIPNLGSIIAVVPPSLMALLQHGPLRGALVLGGLAIFEQIIGNYIDPRMQGRRLQISPVVVLVALVFWTWMWGPAGALLAVPMTVTALAAASYSETLRPLVTLLAHENHDG